MIHIADANVIDGGVEIYIYRFTDVGLSIYVILMLDNDLHQFNVSSADNVFVEKERYQ